ncbi:MAG TPA: hypothetical protein VF941_21435 [Clostridia bacterium]
MKFKKRNILLPLILGIGALIFTTAAFADVQLGSGYDHIKDSMKKSFEKIFKDQSSLTLESITEIKDNQKVVFKHDKKLKLADKWYGSERKESCYSNGIDKVISYFYRDSTGYISLDRSTKSYFVLNRNVPLFKEVYKNPFEESEYKDTEKLMDAVIGSLKNNVRTEITTDKGKKYSINISDSQISPLISAIGSIGFKGHIRYCETLAEISGIVFNDFENDLSELSVKCIKGKAYENKEGILESADMDVLVSAKDNKGIQHMLSINISCKLYDINKTVLKRPDLIGEKVEKVK